jgi:NADH-quinone oxidoreductase subunit E
MLSEEEKREIDEEVRHYGARRAASVDALKVIQRHRRWVSDEGLRDVAEYLEMTIDELDNVATFYNLIFRKPVGRHVILACDSVSCWIMGAAKLRQRLSERLGVALGETTADDRFTLLPIVCLGACDHAPTMMIDEDLWRDVDAEKLDEVLEKYR